MFKIIVTSVVTNAVYLDLFIAKLNVIIKNLVKSMVKFSS